jgi:hypothetical protein
MTEPEWIKNLVSQEDLDELQTKANKIVEGHNTFYEMSVMMSQEDMIEAVRASYGMRAQNEEAWMLGIGILMSLFATMEDALEHEGINIWED